VAAAWYLYLAFGFMITNDPVELDMRKLSVALDPKGLNEIWKTSSL
jgi:hypothetical protein